MDLISKVRLLVGDSYKARINDIIDPVPNGVSTIFQLSSFPLASTPTNPILVNLNSSSVINHPLSASDWSVIDSENGIIQITSAPAASYSYVNFPYYQWSFFSDTTISNSLNFQASDVRYAAVDILNSILADPEGTFFKTYQTGDDTVDDGKFGVVRIQSLRDEILRQTRLPENAGEGFFGHFGLDAYYSTPFSNAIFVQENFGTQ